VYVLLGCHCNMLPFQGANNSTDVAQQCEVCKERAAALLSRRYITLHLTLPLKKSRSLTHQAACMRQSLQG
jgi:hypothetical protein